MRRALRWAKELGWGAGWAEGREEEPVGPLGKKRENTPLGRTRGIGSVLFLLIYIYTYISKPF